MKKITEPPELELYSNYIEEFTFDQIDEFKKYLEQLEFKKTKFFFFKDKKQVFIIIKYKNKIINSLFTKLKNEKTINNLISKIEDISKDIKRYKKKDITFKIIRKDKVKQKKHLNKIFCNIHNKLFPRKKDKFTKIIDFIYDNSKIIFLLNLILMTYSVNSKLEDWGIISNLISFENISIFVNSTFVTALIAIFLFMLFIYLFSSFLNNSLTLLTKPICKDKSINFKTSLSILNITLLLICSFPKFLALDTLNQFAEEYIKKAKEPSLKKAIIQIKELNNKKEYKEENILLLGEKNGILYYLTEANIRDVLKAIPNNICKNTRDKEGKIKYTDFLIELLKLSDINKEKGISSKNPFFTTLKDISFKDEHVDIDEVFCKENKSKDDK